jgi:brefeldin A-resistance guanine nucleotide exchange factor 1
MSIEALRSLFITLFSRLSEHTSPRVTVNDVPPSSPIEQSHGKGILSETAYDPCLAFILELLTALTLRDRGTMKVFGGETAGALQNVIHGGNHVNPIIVSRVVCYLLQLLRSSDVSEVRSLDRPILMPSQDHDFIKTTTILQAFSSLDTDLLQQCAGPLLQGLAACIGGPAPLRNEMTGSPDFWSILHRLRIIPETAAGVFKISENLAGFVHIGISAGSYEATVQLLNEFATTAGVGAVPEQRTQEQRPKSQRQSSPKKAEYAICYPRICYSLTAP